MNHNPPIKKSETKKLKQTNNRIHYSFNFFLDYKKIIKTPKQRELKLNKTKEASNMKIRKEENQNSIREP